MKKHFLLLAVLCLPALALLLLPEQAYAADEDFVSRLVHEFYIKTKPREPTMKRYALSVSRWRVAIEVCSLGINDEPHPTQLDDILTGVVMHLTCTGLFVAVINFDH